MVITLFFCVSFCGCKRFVESSTDELTSKKWCVENASGISARLEFSGDNAELVIYDKGSEKAHISGVFAVDEDRLYITSKKHCKTFCFLYEVYSDRCEISYGEVWLEFYPEDASSGDEIS